MKICLVQQASGPHTELLQLTLPKHLEYCARHHITYLPSFTPTPRDGSAPVWQRYDFIFDALLKGFDGLVWLDADTVIVDPKTDLRGAFQNVRYIGMAKHTTPYVGLRGRLTFHYNAGAMFVRNTAPSLRFLHAVQSRGEIPNPYGWHDQPTIHEIMFETGFTIDEVPAKWNSTQFINEVRKPVVQSFHGQGMNCLPAIKKLVEKF